MLDNYLNLIQYDDSSVSIPPLESHNLMSTKLSNLGGLLINSTSSTNDHYYDGLVKCNYIDSTTMKYMDNDVNLGSYKKEPIKTYTGHPEFYGGILSTVICYFDRVSSKYEYILDVYTTTDRAFTHNVIPDYTLKVLESDTLITYFEVVVDSYSTGTTIIYKIGDDLHIKKYMSGSLYREYTINEPNLNIKKFDKCSDNIMYHCSSATLNNFIILLDISTIFRYDIISVDDKIKNLSFIKIFNGMDYNNNGFVSVDNSKVYKLTKNCEITRVIDYTEYSANITDYSEKTEIITNNELSDIWIKTSTRCYNIKYIDYKNIPVSSINAQAKRDKKVGKFYFVMGYDTAINPFIDYYSYCDKGSVQLKTLNNGYGTKTISFYNTGEIKSNNVFSSGSFSFGDISKNLRPYQYKYSYIINYRSVPNYMDVLNNINKMSRNIELGTRMTSTGINYMSGTFIPLIKYGISANPLFKFSSLKTLYINNCKLK